MSGYGGVTATNPTMKACPIHTKGTINRRWLPLNALRAFEAVGQQKSFTGGAAALSVSQSAMSRHGSGLEELLGKQLFEVAIERLVFIAEYGQGAVVAHRAQGFFAQTGHRRDQELQVFLRVAKGLLAVQ